jgi:hypothetical protein
MKKLSLVIAIFTFIFAACGGKKTNLVDKDLLEYNMPINIMAPADAKYDNRDIGDFNSLTIEDTLGYRLTIESIIAGSLEKDIATIMKDEKALVQADSFFVGFEKEEEAGFIYKLSIDNIVSYDFKYFRIVGDRKYIFKGALGSFHTDLKAVEKMYKAVQPR